MRKVYVVWYIDENGSVMMGSVYSNEEQAAYEAEMLRELGERDAWYTEEQLH